jgi:hypothetical protein
MMKAQEEVEESLEKSIGRRGERCSDKDHKCLIGLRSVKRTEVNSFTQLHGECAESQINGRKETILSLMTFKSQRKQTYPHYGLSKEDESCRRDIS